MKKEKNISFRIVAYTDAAGKYSPESVRGGNEDNFFVNDNLDSEIPKIMNQDAVTQLSSLGVLMVVADGMGGMNAGEIASQIAIDTVRESFVKAKLTPTITHSSDSRGRYMEKVIKAADKAIKLDARNNPEHEGMGSTIVIAWLYNNELTISWCGDSRAYIFNETAGIKLISQDHSYVQELVNKGILTYDQTFDHPQNNIVTRSLGDPSKDAKPESKTVTVGKGDIILLCSDGLSGVLRDRKTFNEKGVPYPEQNIEDILKSNSASMKNCRLALWEAAEKGGWYDNVTVILCQIMEGPASQNSIKYPTNKFNNIKKNPGFIKWGSILVFVIIVIGVLCYFLGKNSSKNSVITTTQEVIINKPDTVETTNLSHDSSNEESASQQVTKDLSTKDQRIEISKNSSQEIIQNDTTSSEITESSKLTQITPDISNTNKPNRSKADESISDPQKSLENPSKENPLINNQ